MLTRRTPISVAEAQKKINEIPLKTTTETIPLSEANHRILAEDVMLIMTILIFAEQEWMGMQF